MIATIKTNPADWSKTCIVLHDRDADGYPSTRTLLLAGLDPAAVAAFLGPLQQAAAAEGYTTTAIIVADLGLRPILEPGATPEAPPLQTGERRLLELAMTQRRASDGAVRDQVVLSEQLPDPVRDAGLELWAAL